MNDPTGGLAAGYNHQNKNDNYHTLTTEGIADSKQDAFRTLFKHELINVKEEFGNGAYSYTEGMTRRTARNIARSRARARVRSYMKELDEMNFEEQQKEIKNNEIDQNSSASAASAL